jgi:hypothetical protein
MSYETQNRPDPKIVHIFEKMSTDELMDLWEHCNAGNYGILSTAIITALNHNRDKS